MKIDSTGMPVPGIRTWTDESGFCAHCRTCGWGVRRPTRDSRDALIAQHERGHTLADRRANTEKGI